MGTRLNQGAPYAYTIDAVFDGRAGSATEPKVRPCALTFAK